MIQLNKVGAIFIKQIKDTLKDTQVLVLYIVYPLLGFIMVTAIAPQVGEENFFIKIFASMHMVFLPIVATASVVAEEKEKSTLKVLMLANVKPITYLIGVGSFIFLGTHLGTLCFAIMGKWSGGSFVSFIMNMMLGSICSMLIGFIVGLVAKNQMGATALTVPLGLVLSLLPMLSSFNTSIEKIAKITYSQQISYLISKPSLRMYTLEQGAIIGINLLLVFIIFFSVYRKQFREV
ncbi:ABC transporter permease [Cellulosilyticum sp. ST5]|uniref:ABC transporter permease n=3 Tax=Cellulosilyticum TaxID=698776 RepID=UPI003977A9CF